MFLLLSVAFAEVPMPVFPECGEEGGCPNDLKDWDLISWIPDNAKDSVRPHELEIGSGLWLDQAVRTQAGRWDVPVAILDSGIEWSHSDLANKVMLNTDELPPPQDAEGNELPYDADENGLVNVLDYAEDPRVSIDAGHDRADHMLDPSDLIYTFSDGVDDDANGFTDDIAGWDFFGDDNDAWPEYSAGFGDHGTGTMREAVGEGNNGGNIGSCPNCALIPIRTGDTFITDGNRAGDGISYATMRGARVIGMAMGALSHPQNTTAALQYAHDNGVVVVAAAGDENTYHHNLPAMVGDILYVHSVHYDGSDEAGSYSFHNFFNCNNYGPRVDLVAASDGCATGSTAKIAGLSGLIISAGLDAGEDLDPDQVKAILFSGVDDIHLSDAELEEAKTYPSEEGWDNFYGHGRVNARKALDFVESGVMPPAARIEGPGWFDYYTTSSDAIEVLVTAEGDAWTLEWAPGWDQDEWTLVDEGTGQADGQVVSFDPSQVTTTQVPPPEATEGVLERVDRVHGPAVTLRLSVTENGLTTEARRTFYVYDDPDLKPGFPLRLGASAESSPILVDLDGDMVFEVVLGDADGVVRAIYGDGTDVQGWPVRTDTDDDALRHAEAAYYGVLDAEQSDGILATVAAGDLDGDGSPEVVAATLEGRVHAWHADGTPVDGFPVRTLGRTPEEYDDDHTYDMGVAGAPTLADLDGDGTLEVIVAAMDSRMYVWTHDGQDFAPYPVEICHPENCGRLGFRTIVSPTVGDIDADGDLDFVFGTNETINNGNESVTHAWDALTGEALAGWPRGQTGLVSEAALLPLIGSGHPASVALVDLDDDGDLEIVDAIMIGQTDVVHHDGSLALDLGYAADTYGELSNADEPSFVSLTNNPGVGDLTGDGVPDVFMGGSGTYALIGLALTTAIDFQQVLGGWDGATGEALIGWPQQIEDLQFLVAPAIADLSGDGKAEVVYGSAGFMLHAWDEEGTPAPNWPKFTGQWILGSPAIGDIDGDGYLDVVISTREGWLFAWTTQGHADQQVQWASIHHDPANTGNYETPLMPQIGPDLDVCADRGCCCRARSERLDGLALLLVPLLFGLVRRRSRDGSVS
ncbi:MAG: S8 family serine peptidase [Proteobacteria bacterium]|nr:S8 family serine peptidase [Pseudomonadota bacterium]